ncbi:MAG TPA: MlaD family protein [Chthoniobacteraceae bacterium]|jgi:phospholipid/cholesterol/gamma-HCH transport system substrate-binding protein|nr:MlaD family protein [Chthoniobacteraceae bacterium]
MKAQDRSNFITSAIVILCSGILLAALTFALTGFSWKAGGRTLSIEFRDATGIKQNSSVRYAGKTAGTIREIRYLSTEERSKALDPNYAVRVTLQLDPDVPPLQEGVRASMGAETLLGEKFIALTPGKPDGKPLRDGEIIYGTTGTSIDAVAGSANEAIQRVNAILTSFQGDYPSLIPRLAELLAQGNSILGQGSNLVENVDATISNANSAVTKLKEDYDSLVPKLSSVFSQAQTIATNADQTILKVSALIDRLDGAVKTNEGDLEKTLDELRVASQNLKVITTYAKALSAALAEKPSTLVWGRKKRELPSEQAILESSEPLRLDSHGTRKNP